MKARLFVMFALWSSTIVLDGGSAALLAAGAETPTAQNSSASANCFTPTTIPLAPRNTSRAVAYTLVSGPSHGTVSLPVGPVRSASAMVCVYTSARDYVGPDSFTWKVSDGSADSNVATCSIIVKAAAPAAEPRTAACAVENTAVDIPACYTGGGTTYTITHADPAHGKVTLNGRTFRYTPNSGYIGADSFTWRLDGSGDAKASPAAGKAGVCCVVVKKAGMTDWPQWRADEWRSGFTTMNLPAALHLQWRRDLPQAPGPFAARGGNLYPDIDRCRPVQLGKTLFVPIVASDCLAAYDTDTGNLRWRFYASGAVRRPPAAVARADGAAVVVLGSDDGWVYGLNAADGSVRWKFHAAPNNRTAMGFGRLSSVWPVWASPVACDGKVYFAAGYVPSFGLYAYCLDAATGTVRWVNDGRVSDMWNTSAFGPLAVSYDHTRIYGSVEGACRPWVLDSSAGEYLGHLDVGFGFPGGGRNSGPFATRNGSCGWFVDGMGSYNAPETMTITVGPKTFTPADAAALGVIGTVASMLAGDGKLFVTTADSSIYCFGGTAGKPVVHVLSPTTRPDVSDNWTAAAKAMLNREDLKQGLALVLGLGKGADAGRLVEELARQSSLMVVAVDADHARLQALRAKMDDAGLPAARVSTLEGSPMDFAFAPCQAAIITSEDAAAAGLVDAQKTDESRLVKLYEWTRPFGGEVWLPTADQQHAAIARIVASSKAMPLCEVARSSSGGFTRIKRMGLPDGKLDVRPPFGLVAFGHVVEEASYRPPLTGRDPFTWLPLKAAGPGRVPPAPGNGAKVGYPDAAAISTDRSVFTSMVNPLFGVVEKFPGLPATGNDGACNGGANHQYGDYGLTAGKLASFFDTSSNYWGRLFMPELGGCPGRTFMTDGVVVVSSSPVPGSVCGCEASMQFTDVALMPMPGEETWVAYQTVRTSNPVEELPIRQIGVNFAAPGDRFVGEDGTLWTHHPYCGRYGRSSYNAAATPAALPLVPVSYAGPVTGVYHHSAQVDGMSSRDRRWVSASYVKGMSEIVIPLAQPAVAVRAAAPPKVDGSLNDPCWGGGPRLVMVPDAATMDPNRAWGPPKPGDECFAMLRYDDTNLYVAAGARAGFGPAGKRFLTVTLNSRERIAADVVLTCGDAAKRGVGKEARGIDAFAWSCAAAATAKDPFTAEMAIPWKSLAAAGLWKEQLIVNVNVSGSLLAGQYTPLYLDAARGAATEAHPHTIRLYFAEMEGVKPGERVFDVSLQGKGVLKNLDVVNEAGGAKRELVKEFKGVAISDRLTVGFTPHAGQPMLSGVEIVGNYTAADHAPNTPPTAAIESSATAGPAPLEVTLDARASRDPDGQIVQCAWDTGDGRLARGSRLRHVFAEAGTYKVRLLVRDNRGGTAEANTTITVATGVPAAFVCDIRAKDGDYASLSVWESAIRGDLMAAPKSGGPAAGSLLFAVKDRQTYTPADDGQPVTFTGGGTGTLRHINRGDIAYVTNCAGTIAPGPVLCASKSAFTISDGGHPIYLAVAECHNDWPAGLTDRVATAPDGPGWTTDPIRCAVIRPAAGQGHRGKISDGAERYTGFALNGDLDLRGMPYTRVTGLIIDPARAFFTGRGASVSRVLAGAVTVWEDSTVVDSVATTFSAATSGNTVNKHMSFYALNYRDGVGKTKPPGLSSVVNAGIGFRNCTAATFDPGNQAGVEFINCTAAPGGKGFHDARYSEPAYVSQCVIPDGRAAPWSSGDW